MYIFVRTIKLFLHTHTQIYLHSPGSCSENRHARDVTAHGKHFHLLKPAHGGARTKPNANATTSGAFECGVRCVVPYEMRARARAPSQTLYNATFVFTDHSSCGCVPLHRAGQRRCLPGFLRRASHASAAMNRSTESDAGACYAFVRGADKALHFFLHCYSANAKFT